MKTLKEYLTESKKTYNFKIKVAGELPENFQDNLKTSLDRCKVMTLKKLSTTPIQASPIDFPALKNCEVHIFEVVCEYPITSPEIINDIKTIGLDECCFRVRGSDEPAETELMVADLEPSKEVLLADVDAGNPKVKGKDYFGDDFNRSFLKDLEKTAKARKKEEGQGEYKLPKGKQDKAGTKSALGS
jgi:hypothetical protein